MTDPAEFPCVTLSDDLEQAEPCRDLLALPDRAEQTAIGVTTKGIQAIRLLAQGYSNREIGDLYGASANNVLAWAAKAHKHLAKVAT